MKTVSFLLLFLSFPLVAQRFTAQDLQQQLDLYYPNFLPCNVHIFTNQPEYAPGDTVYFKVHLSGLNELLASQEKTILSATLLTSDGEKIVRSLFSIKGGLGTNQFMLPANLPRGEYYLELSTDLSTETNLLCYTKLIRVGSSVVPVSSNISAAAEGGKLIAGLNCKVVAVGRPFSHGAIKENDIEILKFNFDRNGLFTLNITPKKNSRYGIYEGQHRFALPDVEEDGIALHTTRIQSSNKTRVYLSAPVQSIYRSTTVHLIMRAQGTIYQASEIAFQDQSFFLLDIPMDSFPRGIIQITLLDDQKNIIADRHIFNPEAQPITTTLTLPKKHFNVRERIDLKLKTSNALASRISLTCFNRSVAPKDSSVNSYSTIRKDLYSVPNPAMRSQAAFTTEDPSIIDNKLVLERSDFDWKNVPTKKQQPSINKYMQFSGTVYDVTKNKPITDSTRITFFFQKNVSTYQTYSDSGEFTVTMLFDFYNADEVFYRIEQDGKLLPNARVRIKENTFIKPGNASTEKSISEYHALFDKRKIIQESYAYHGTRSRFSRQPASSLLEDEIFGADLIIKMDDYHLLPTMIETLHEIIPLSQYRKVKGQNVVRIYNKDTERFRTVDPVYVIDGVMTDDTDYFLSLSPADVATIKLVHSNGKLNTLGSIGSGGMFIVETKIPGNNKNVSRSVRTFTMQGLTESIPGAVVSNSKNSSTRVPDLRTNLAWIPLLETNGNGEAMVSFYTSDVPGKYRIEGEGFSSDGRYFTFEEDFEVGFNN